MIDNGQDAFVEMEAFYQQGSIFYFPEDVRWSKIKANTQTGTNETISKLR
ncbi:hypothetical protein [Aliivibrio wodanis]